MKYLIGKKKAMKRGYRYNLLMKVRLSIVKSLFSQIHELTSFLTQILKSFWGIRKADFKSHMKKWRSKEVRKILKNKEEFTLQMCVILFLNIS